jgi:hypothetical protein
MTKLFFYSPLEIAGQEITMANIFISATTTKGSPAGLPFAVSKFPAGR